MGKKQKRKNCMPEKYLFSENEKTSNIGMYFENKKLDNRFDIPHKGKGKIHVFAYGDLKFVRTFFSKSDYISLLSLTGFFL